MTLPITTTSIWRLLKKAFMMTTAANKEEKEEASLSRRQKSMSGSMARGQTPGRESIVSRRRDAYAEFYEYSTFHGVSDIYRAGGCLRYFWLTLFIGAVVFAIYGCYLIVDQFKGAPFVVSYFVEEAEAGVLQIPDVTICPFNRFNRDFLRKLGIRDDVAQYMELSFPSPIMHTFQKRKLMNIFPFEMEKLNIELEFILAAWNLSFTELINDAALKCEEVFIPTKNETVQELCSRTLNQMTSAGKCWRFPGASQYGNGFGNGNRIMLRLPRHLFNPGVNQLLLDGVAVKLAETGTVNYDLTFIPSGVHAIMPLTATRYEFMDDPPRYKCRARESETYNRVWCFEECILSEAEEVCKCSVAPSINPRKSFCTANDIYWCLFGELAKTTKNKTQACTDKCGPSCSYWEYKTSISYARFPSPETRYFFDNSTEYDQMELHNMIILDVFFERSEYTKIKHMHAMTASSFIAQLGGQISLWIGGSVLTVIQVVVFLSKLFWQWCRNAYNWERRKWRAWKEALMPGVIVGSPSAGGAVALTIRDLEEGGGNDTYPMVYNYGHQLQGMGLPNGTSVSVEAPRHNSLYKSRLLPRRNVGKGVISRKYRKNNYSSRRYFDGQKYDDEPGTSVDPRAPSSPRNGDISSISAECETV